ncbi:DUF1189 family protein [Fundicoccus culcitae]|uniref:DUF1189 domain-containing protein n=1 Tax=Fundicoccus culcitae TaxID=2969821 RepID=A0ABY5P770_9LACT|nr:DUF1189 family protein [Fundicoccus culcitae]UUX34587.1 DUF1189 domain-containing protein [Fundicoccus culcitae]
MRQLFKLLFQALRNPRHYIETINMKWRTILILPLIATLVITMNLLVLTDTILEGFFSDISMATQYVPEYTIEEATLTLNEAEKPLYYQSDFFQLVIDDTIENRGIQMNIPIPNEKAAAISDDTPLNLFLFKNQAVAMIGGVHNILDYSNPLLSNDRLTSLMSSVNNQQFSILSAVFISYFVSATIFYWIQMFVIALLAGIFNMRLTQPLKYRTRLKLTVIISFVPLILIQIINSLFPTIQYSTYLLQIITLFIYYMALKDHSRFIRSLMEKFNIRKK